MGVELAAAQHSVLVAVVFYHTHTLSIVAVTIVTTAPQQWAWHWRNTKMATPLPYHEEKHRQPNCA